MYASEHSPVEGDGGQQPQSESPELDFEFSWTNELQRRGERLQQLLEAEKDNPSVDEPWRLQLVRRALFSTWLDERATNRTTHRFEIVH